MRPRILAITGPLKGCAFQITSSELILGRDEANSICLEDDLASRQHTSLRLEDDRVVVRDLDSTNGTFVNNSSVSIKVLEHGDRLKIGSSVFI